MIEAMTTATRTAWRPRWALALLAAVLAVGAGLSGAGPASALTVSAAETRVGASHSAAGVAVGPSTGITAGQRLGNDPPRAGIVVATVVAANTATALSRPSSRVLGANLEAAGAVRPAGSAAHHIVAGSSARAAEARAVLQRYGIDINDAGNGVFLPGRMTSPNPTGAAVHSRIHTNAYYAEVNSLLGQATTRGEALDALAYVRSQLLSGGFP